MLLFILKSTAHYCNDKTCPAKVFCLQSDRLLSVIRRTECSVSEDQLSTDILVRVAFIYIFAGLLQLSPAAWTHPCRSNIVRWINKTINSPPACVPASLDVRASRAVKQSYITCRHRAGTWRLPLSGQLDGQTVGPISELAVQPAGIEVVVILGRAAAAEGQGDF